MNLVTKQKWTHRHRKQTYGYQRGCGGTIQGLETGRYKLLGVRQGCIVQHGEYSQYFVITENGV